MDGQPVAPVAEPSAPPAPVYAYDPETDKKQSRAKVIRSEQLPLLDTHQNGFSLPPLEFLKPTPVGVVGEVLSDEELQKTG